MRLPIRAQSPFWGPLARPMRESEQDARRGTQQLAIRRWMWEDGVGVEEWECRLMAHAQGRRGRTQGRVARVATEVRGSLHPWLVICATA